MEPLRCPVCVERGYGETEVIEYAAFEHAKQARRTVDGRMSRQAAWEYGQLILATHGVRIDPLN